MEGHPGERDHQRGRWSWPKICQRGRCVLYQRPFGRLRPTAKNKARVRSKAHAILSRYRYQQLHHLGGAVQQRHKMKSGRRNSFCRSRFNALGLRQSDAVFSHVKPIGSLAGRAARPSLPHLRGGGFHTSTGSGGLLHALLSCGRCCCIFGCRGTGGPQIPGFPTRRAM